MLFVSVFVYQKGAFDEADSLYVRALDIAEKTLGAENTEEVVSLLSARALLLNNEVRLFVGYATPIGALQNNWD